MTKASTPTDTPPRSPGRGQLWLRRLKWVLPLVALLIAFRFLPFGAIPVREESALAGTVESEVLGTGTLGARVSIAVSPKLSGRLVEVLVDQNDTIRAGQLLARIEDGEWLQQVEVARASLAAARATVERVRVDEARAEAVVRLTRLEHQRSRELLATKAVAVSEFDRAEQALRVAEVDLQRARFAINEAERQVLTAEKTLRYHEERLEDTRLLSPVDGLVVKRHREPGEVVVPGTAVLDLVDTREIWVSAWVDETALAGLAESQPARVVFRSEPERTYDGVVARLGRQTDPETREFVVDVRLATLPSNWTVGQRAEVFIRTASRDAAITVPAAAVVHRSGEPGVFVAAGGRARWRPIKTGLSGRERVEVREGLAAGERVVLSQNVRIALGEGVRIRIR